MFSPGSILWRYATGYMPDFLDGKSGPVGWVRWPHRGVQMLEKFEVPRKQKPYVLSDEFELRFDTAFEQTVRACADVARPAIRDGVGQTWITPDLIAGLLELHRRGFAHSYEAWQAGQLVGGTFGVHLGGYVNMISLFHRVPNAAKAAAGRAMMHLRERGFRLIDIGMVPDHHVDFGSEWMPRWKYEATLAGLIRQRLSIADDRPCPSMPARVRLGVPLVRAYRGVRRRLLLRRDA
jgi:leucyl/phenylalanyl-tRNA--protein transferase